MNIKREGGRILSSTHMVREEIVGVEGGLLEQLVWRGEYRGNGIDELGIVCHSNDVCITNEDIEP